MFSFTDNVASFHNSYIHTELFLSYFLQDPLILNKIEINEKELKPP